MQRVTRLGAVLALALLFGAAAPAASAYPAADGSDPDSEAVASLIEKGDAMIVDGKFGPARQAYEKAAALVRESGELPTEAVRRIANSFYFEGRLQSAARVLDELSEESALYGDLKAQAWALADAAWAYGKLGSGLEVTRRVEQLERLLRSPYMPTSVRDRIARVRLGEETTLGLR